MRHATDACLDSIEPFLTAVRRALGPGLTERKRGVFYAGGRACLHFHEDPSGVYADLRLPGDADWERLLVSSPAGQRTVLARLGDGAPR